MTGSLSRADAAGVHTFRYRQSSLTGAVLPCEFGACMQACAKASAGFTPDQGRTGAGAFQRSAPTGGAANGMPLKIDRPFSAVPLISPPVTRARLICAWAPGTHNAARITHRMLRI